MSTKSRNERDFATSFEDEYFEGFVVDHGFERVAGNLARASLGQLVDDNRLLEGGHRSDRLAHNGVDLVEQLFLARRRIFFFQ